MQFTLMCKFFSFTELKSDVNYKPWSPVFMSPSLHDLKGRNFSDFFSEYIKDHTICPFKSKEVSLRDEVKVKVKAKSHWETPTELPLSL